MTDKDPEFLPHGEDQGVHVRSTEEARQAATTGHMRYVLAASLALVVLLFALIYFHVI